MLYRMKIDPMEWERKDVRWGDTVLVRVFANGEAEIARVLEHERNGEERPARLPQNGIRWRKILWLPTPGVSVEGDKGDGAGFSNGFAEFSRQLEVENPNADVDRQNAAVGR